MRVEVSFKHLEKTKGLKEHVQATIGELDRFAPKRRREHMHASVNIDQKSVKSEIVAKANLHMKGKDIAATEKGKDPFTVIDVLENKLKTQLKKQRSKHRKHRLNPKRIKQLRK